MKNQKINGLILASTFAVGVANTNATATSAKLSGSIKDSKNSSKNDSKTANSQAIKNIAGSLTSGKLPVVAFGTAYASLLACYAASCIKSSDDKETPEEKPEEEKPEEEKDEPQKEKENDDKKSTSNLWPILVVVVIIVIGFGIWCKTKIDFVSEDKLKSISGISDDELREVTDGDISTYKEYFSNNIKNGIKYLQLIKKGKDENETIRLVANDDFGLDGFREALALFLSVAARLLPNTVSGIANLKLENGFWCCDDEGAEALSMNLFETNKINLKFIKLDEYVTFHKSILENKKISKKTLCKYIVKVNSMQPTFGKLKGRLFYSTLSPLTLIQAALDPRSNINEGVDAVKTAIADKFGKYVDELKDVDRGVLSEKNKKFLEFMKNVVNIYNDELNKYTEKVLCGTEDSKDFCKKKQDAMNDTTEFPKFVLEDCFKKIKNKDQNIKCYLCLAKIVIMDKLATAFHKKEEDIEKLIKTMNKISDLDTNYSEEKLNEIQKMLGIESQQPTNGSNNASLINDTNQNNN